MFKYSVTVDGSHVTLILDDYTDKPQTWIIPRYTPLGAKLAELADTNTETLGQP